MDGVATGYDGVRKENALHGERLIATVRLLLLVFRSVIMTVWAMSQASPPPPGLLRSVALPSYFVLCVVTIVALRRAKSSARWLPFAPHVLNLVDYAFILAMSVPATEHDPGAQRELLAMSLALILSYSVAREGALQAVVSTFLACASYLLAVRWVPGSTTAATAFIVGSFAAFSALALRVVIGLRKRASEAMRLGQYTLTERLGEGGMGEVYRATHAMLRRPTAVKLLKGQNETSLQRFEREVQLTARLKHPNTIAIFDYGRTPDGIFYYAMEYLDGLTLEQLVEEHGPQPPARVVHVLRQICGSLGEAHAVGLIHRDVKPANIALCDRGRAFDFVKVLDFGLVKNVATAGDTDTTDRMLTGTPLYLSPEAIAAPEKVDARSDLYAVGAVGYYLLTGDHVFGGRTLVEVCSHHLHTLPVRPSEKLGTPLPRDLEDVLLACLEKRPEARPRDANALAKQLAQCSCVDEWGDDEASAWWRDNRASVTRLTAARATALPERSFAVDPRR